MCSSVCGCHHVSVVGVFNDMICEAVSGMASLRGSHPNLLITICIIKTER